MSQTTSSSLQITLAQMSKAIKAVVYGTAIIGTGYLLMRFTVPNEEQMRAVMPLFSQAFFST